MKRHLSYLFVLVILSVLLLSSCMGDDVQDEGNSENMAADSIFGETTSPSEEYESGGIADTSEAQTENTEETSEAVLYNKEVSILSEDKTLKRPSEEFLRKALAENFNEHGTVVFCLNSDGTYFVPDEGTFYDYINADKQYIYDTLAKELDRDYYEENKEKINARDNVSSYEEYIKILEGFYGEEWMEIYRTYAPDNIETVVQFVVYPSAYGSDFAAGSSDYSNEEVFLKLAEQLFKDTDIMTYAMTERLESGDNFYVRAAGEYKGDNVVKYRSAFGYNLYEVSNAMDHSSGKYFTMDGSELPEEYKNQGY